jgi:hypothetical protein
LNFVGYRFKGPVAINTNWYIARADYKLTSSGNQTIFWRGALRNDTDAGVPYLPGGGPESTQVDYSKGYSVGYTRAEVKSCEQFPLRLHPPELSARAGNPDTGHHFFPRAQ